MYFKCVLHMKCCVWSNYHAKLWYNSIPWFSMILFYVTAVFSCYFATKNLRRIQLHFIDILYNIHGQMTICIWLYGIIIIFHCGFVDLIHYKRSQTRTFSSGWTTFRWPFQGRTKPWNTGVTQWSVFVSGAGFKCSTDIASSNSAWCITNFWSCCIFHILK